MPGLSAENFALFIRAMDKHVNTIIKLNDSKANGEQLNEEFAKMLTVLNNLKTSVQDSNKATLETKLLEDQFVKSVLGIRVPAYMPPFNVFYSDGPVRDATVLQFLIDIYAITEDTVTTLLNSLSPDNLWKLLTARGTQHAVAPAIARMLPNATNNEGYKSDNSYVYPLHHLLSRFPHKAVEIFIRLQQHAIKAMLLDSPTSFALNGKSASALPRRAIEWLPTDDDRLAEILNVIPPSKEFVVFASALRGRVMSAHVWSRLSLKARLLFALDLEANSIFGNIGTQHSFSSLIKTLELRNALLSIGEAFAAVMQNYSTAEHIKLITAALCESSWKTDVKKELLDQFNIRTQSSKVSLVAKLGNVLYKLLQHDGKLPDDTIVPDQEKESNGTKEMVAFLLTYADNDIKTTLDALVKVLADRWVRAAKSYNSDKSKATNVLYMTVYDMLLKFIPQNNTPVDITTLSGYKMLLLRQQEDLSPWIKLHEKIATILQTLAKQQNAGKSQEFADWFAKLVSAKKHGDIIASIDLLGTNGSSIPKAGAFDSRLNIFSGSTQASRQELVDLAKLCATTDPGNYERWLLPENEDTTASEESKQLRVVVRQKIETDAAAIVAEREAKQERLLEIAQNPFGA